MCVCVCICLRVWWKWFFTCVRVLFVSTSIICTVWKLSRHQIFSTLLIVQRRKDWHARKLKETTLTSHTNKPHHTTHTQHTTRHYHHPLVKTTKREKKPKKKIKNKRDSRRRRMDKSKRWRLLRYSKNTVNEKWESRKTNSQSGVHLTLRDTKVWEKEMFLLFVYVKERNTFLIISPSHQSKR